jgi:hypothetical protein
MPSWLTNSKNVLHYHSSLASPEHKFSNKVTALNAAAAPAPAALAPVRVPVAPAAVLSLLKIPVTTMLTIHLIS